MGLSWAVNAVVSLVVHQGPNTLVDAGDMAARKLVDRRDAPRDPSHLAFAGLMAASDHALTQLVQREL
ncbi:hypothetical protein Ae201684_009239 [Aphanomyces euteiches]|uniref:Uncharacterized protein n=1 Tax=Aphanomyces euteiches TaxID=100861 RepID=A0A6G0X2M9_9STRA|nr:hypothetical protein Ae201684_009239 [Aphanomyces euteiches]